MYYLDIWQLQISNLLNKDKFVSRFFFVQQPMLHTHLYTIAQNERTQIDFSHRGGGGK